MVRFSGNAAAAIAASVRRAAQQNETPTETQQVQQADNSQRDELVEKVLDSMEIKKKDFLESDQKTRFSSAEWLKYIQKETVSIIGCGGIGSWTSLLLARTGVGGIYSYDFDIIESQNMAGQLFRLQDLGKHKVDAMKEIIKEYVPTLKGAFLSESYTNQPLSRITITALDSIAVRKIVFEQYCEQYKNYHDKSKCLFIDGRMSAEAFQVFIFRLSQEDKIKEYEQSLFEDSKATGNVCSYKATSYVGAMIGAYITALVKEHLHFSSDEYFAENIPYFHEIDTSFGIKIKTQSTWKFQ